MAASPESVTFSIEVELSKLNAQLATIPNTTKREAMNATATLKRSIDEFARVAKAQTTATVRQVEGVGKAVEKSTGAAKAGAVNLLNQLSDVTSQLTTGTSPMTILIQQGPQIAGALDLMGVSFTRMLAVAAPVVAVLGLGAAAYASYASAAADAAEAQDKARASTEQTIKIQSALADAVIKNAVLRGEMSAAEGDAYSAAQTAGELYSIQKRAIIDDINAEATALADLQKQQEYAVGSTGSLNARQAFAISVGTDLRRTTEALTEEQKKHRTKLAELGEALGSLTAEEQAYAQVLAENEGLQRQSKDTIDPLIKRINDQADAIAEITARYKEYDRELAQLRGMEASATRSQMDDIEQVRAAQEDALNQAAELYREASANAQTSAERRAKVEEQYAATVVAINDEAAFKIDKIRADAAAREAARQEKAAKDAERLRDQQIAAAADLTRTVGGYMGDVASVADAAYSRQVDTIGRLNAQLGAGEEYLTETQKAELNTRIRLQEKAARRAFEVSKALRIAQATANAYAAASQAFAEVPYPFNFAAGATALAAGLVNVAQIASTQPAFHRGGMIDEQRITALSGEAVLSRQGVQALGGEQAVNRINGTGGAASGGAPVYAVSVYRHDRITERWQRDGLRRGDPVSRAIASARTVPYGHRS